MLPAQASKVCGRCEGHGVREALSAAWLSLWSCCTVLAPWLPDGHRGQTRQADPQTVQHATDSSQPPQGKRSVLGLVHLHYMCVQVCICACWGVCTQG